MSHAITVYPFGLKTFGSDYECPGKEVLGGKGYNLADMSKNGVPVPPGFTFPTTLCGSVLKGFIKPDEFLSVVVTGLSALTSHFGYTPLLSVRSGSRVSLPGACDTILNIGITSANLDSWKTRLGEVAALDSYRRLLQMYGSVVFGIPEAIFEQELALTKQDEGVTSDTELSANALTKLVTCYKNVIDNNGYHFPDSVQDQILGAIIAVYKSWDNPRALEYRKINKIPSSWGTAATVQAMVFGNLNNNSCTGVVFTRDPSTGVRKLTGEYLVNAQGEDVVAGIRTPEHIQTLETWDKGVYAELVSIANNLEAQYTDVQDIEFTVQDKELYILQTRNAKRGALAAFQIVYDFVNEGVLKKSQIEERLTQSQLFAALQPTVDPSFKGTPILTGIAAGGGIVTGKVVFSSESAVKCTSPCVLVTKETSPEDIAGINASVGILTTTGGFSCHAAVVARGMDKTCVVGCQGMRLTPTGAIQKGTATHLFSEGSVITLNGATGDVYLGEVPTLAGGASEAVRAVLGWLQAPGTSSRLDLHPGMSTAEFYAAVKVYTGGVIHIDTALLEAHNRVLTSDLTASIVDLGKSLSWVVDCSGGLKVVVDLSSVYQCLGLTDRALDRMFGIAVNTYEESSESLKVAGLLKWSKPLRGVTLVKGLATKETASTLSSAGFMLEVEVSTVDDLLTANGAVAVSDSTISKVFGSQSAYDFVVDALKASGKSVGVRVPAPKHWYELFFN